MIVSMHQPAYLPWLGYFDRIAKSDVFIFMDTVQFERNSFTNRNRIKTATGTQWLTVPVLLHEHLGKTVADIQIDERQDWRRKHLRSLEQNYRRSAAFALRYDRLAKQYSERSGFLAELCFYQLLFWLGELEITTRIVRASTLVAGGQKSDLVLSLCRAVGGTTYLSGPIGRDYLDVPSFAAAGIELRYHQFDHPTYPQLYGQFQPAMAVVDYWLNCPTLDLFKVK